MAYNGIFGLAFDAQGNLIAGSSTDSAIYRINLTTGVRTTLASGVVGTGPVVGGPGGLLVDTDGTIVYTDFRNSSVWRLVRLDPTTLVRTHIASPSVVPTVGTGTVTGQSGTVVKLSNGSFAVSCYNGNATQWVTRIDPATGNRTILTGNATGTGTTIGTTFSLSLGSDGSVYSADFTNNAILRVDPTTGNRTVTSSLALSAGTGPAFSRPLGILPVTVDSVTTPPPAITSASTASGTNGAAFSYTITASNTPTSFGATGLPTGLTVNSSTGVVSGTITQAGSFPVTLSATGAGGTGTATLTLTVAKAAQTITFPAPANKIPTDAPFALTATSNSGLTVSYTIVSGPATVSGSTLTLTGASGTVVVNASQTGNANYNAATDVSQQFTVANAAPQISSASTGSGVYGSAFSYTITASNTPTSFNATGLPTGLSVNTSTGAISGTITQTGTFPVSLSATNAGGTGTATLTLTVAKSTAATLVLGSLTQTYDGSAKSVTTITTPAGMNVNLTYNGSATPPVDAGSYAVSGAVNNSFYVATASGTLVIGKASQIVSFASVGNVIVQKPVALIASASSGQPVSFSVVSGNASISGNTLTVKDSKPVTLRATQSGDDNYDAASADQAIAGATKASQTITFATLGDKRNVDPAFTLSATASSGLSVTFTVPSGPAMLNGSTLTLTGAPGTVTIVASQAGNDVYAAAPDVVQTFNVVPIGPLDYFGSLSSGTQRGDFAAQVNQDGKSGTMIGIIPTTGEAFVVDFKPGTDGTWVATATTFTADAIAGSSLDGETRTATAISVAGQGSGSSIAERATASRTFRGVVSGSILSGSIDGLSTTFTASLVPPVGPTAAIAGYYQSASLQTASGSIYSIIGTTGQAYVLAITPNYVGGNLGTVQSNGGFTASTAGSTTISGSVNAVNTTLTGSLARPGKPAESFAGLAVTTTRTDRMINFSTRARVGGSAGPLITGFVIGGTEPKTVLLRGVGPTLASLGVTDALPAARLRLFDSQGRVLREADGWQADTTLTTTFARLGAFPLGSGNKDSAVIATLPPGAYSMHVLASATGNETGTALAEIYDASANPQGEYQRLVNISSRGTVLPDSVLVGGFIITGNLPKRVLIRGVGPELARYGIGDPIADPTLSVYLGGTVLARNDNWGTPVVVNVSQTASTPDELIAVTRQVGAFALTAGSRDAAVVVTLAPGAYTAHVASANGSTGTALIEIYEVQN